MINGLTTSIYAGILAGMGGTGLGALIGIIIAGLINKKNNTKRLETFVRLSLSFSGGIMFIIVCVDLLPESVNYAGIIIGSISIIIGCALMPIFEILNNTVNSFSRGLNRNKFSHMNTNGENRYLKTGILVAMSVAIHNFPEGLAIGASFNVTGSFGMVLALVIAFHDIPEGIAMATPLLVSKINPFKILLVSILSGMPMVIGAVIGWLSAEISSVFIGACLVFAGGTMMYVVVGQLLPICYKPKVYVSTIFAIMLGIISGFIIINIIS
jgi:zinc transporter, ZIP family